MSNKVKRVLGDKIILADPALETKRADYGLIVPQVLTNVGVIRYIGDDVASKALAIGLEVGQKVVYSTQFEKLEIENVTSMVMKLDNIVAILE